MYQSRGASIKENEKMEDRALLFELFRIFSM
jgi:hypothetical protein